MSKLPPLPSIGSLNINLPLSIPDQKKTPTSLPSLTKAPLPPLETKAPLSSKAPLPSLTSLPPLQSKAPLPPLETKAPLPALSSLPPLETKAPLPALSSLPPLETKSLETKAPLKSPLPPLETKAPLKSPLPVLEKKSPLKIAEAFIPSPSVPVKHLETLFGVRNGITGYPVEGKNFDKETLSYMTSKSRADEITQLIVDRMGGKTFEIWENTGGIGGNTLSFAENPKISRVTVYEIVPERREMLKRNLEMYGLSGKVTVLDSAFEGKDIPIGAVYFADPPWLSTGIKGHESAKEDYLLSGLEIGGKKLEEWIASCSQCGLVALKVPLGYSLSPVANFTTENIQLKNMSLLLSKPVLNNITIRKEKEREEYLIWREELRKFLRYEILPRCVSSEDALNKLTSDAAMDKWEIAFTHESFTIEKGKNYEEYELLGDDVTSAAYTRFLIQSYPEFDRSQLSEMRTTYLAKMFQSQLSKSLGLGKYVRTRFGMSVHIHEDVLESFMGCLDILGDEMIRKPVGSGLVFNMVVSLYKDIEIDPSATIASAKTRIKEIFERLGIIFPKLGQKVPEEFYKKDDGKTVLRIKIPPNGMKILSDYGFKLTSDVIAEAVEYTKKRAENTAYKLAITNLRDIGVTDEFVNEVVKRREMNNPELKAYFEGIQERLKSEGFVDFYFKEHHVKSFDSGTGGKYIQLIGIKADGKKEILETTETPVENVIHGKQDLLTKYRNYQ